MTDRRRWHGAGLVLLAVALGCGATPAAASPGNAFVALERAPAAGTFDAAAYLAGPTGLVARAASHPHGWSIAWRCADPPPGWTRPFIARGGGPAASDGALHPRYASSLARMLARRDAGIVALLDAPDTAACFPGKPNPHPLERDGWLFLHDGYAGVEALTQGIWRADWGPAWETFRATHPRDYDGNADSTRGNAGEIYFLTLLYEIGQGPGGVPEAFERVLLELSLLPGFESWQCNALLQGPGGTYALRYAQSAAEHYRLFYTTTVDGEYCLADSLPPGAFGWAEIPNFSLAVFPRAGALEILPVELPSAVQVPPGGADEGPGGDGGATARPRVRLMPAATPCVGSVRLRYDLPAHAPGWIEIWSVEGRRLARFPADATNAELTWTPPAAVGSGLLLARLTTGTVARHTRFLFVR